jgi:hypothetical protein
LANEAERQRCKKLEPGVKLLIGGCSPLSAGDCEGGWGRATYDVQQRRQTNRNQAAVRSGGATTPTSEQSTMLMRDVIAA